MCLCCAALGSHRAILIAAGALLFALAAADFAVDRALDAQLLAILHGETAAERDPRVVRLEWARTAEQAALFFGLIAALSVALVWTRRTERLRVEWEGSERARLDLRRMAGSLAHELNGQLGVLQNTLSILAREFPGHEALRFQQESVDQMSALVADFMLFGKPESLALSDVDARALAAGVVAALPMDMDVLIEGPALLPMRADEKALRRALQNLLRNANEAGGPVRLRIEPSPGRVRFVVYDDGPGLSPEAQRRAGEPFYTTKPRGTGLGLAIVKEIALRHGGSLTLRNREGGRGAEAVLEIPVLS